MKSRAHQRAKNKTRVGMPLAAVATLCWTLAGCASFPVAKETYAPGKVLILPPRDVVQNGQPHAKGTETGERLMTNMERYFRDTSFEPMTTQNRSFNHTEIAGAESARAEARQVGADYYLQIVLGEFRNAAPMTFRSDFVWIGSAAMLEARTGRQVWALSRPLYLEKTNLGNCYPLLNQFAEKMVRSIAAPSR